ncbi:hypothetical protein CSKR_103505 [Clonorchis sinensis]|uniref:Histone RNA hairpin-binding protein RNA-binding domain-containing protein n=2 Tax=Clonorchis sinensis TaxID=79923 RepID=A0A8T1MJ30_CLOSI|nr:hypothetical protein CSKR_103505 [Clonorchis sinensis]
MESDNRRARKSAPVKNAVFLGALHKDRARVYALRELNVAAKDGSSGSSAVKQESKSNLGSSVHVSESRSRRATLPNFGKKSMRMSTPVRDCGSSPRYRTRHRSRQETTSEHDRSHSIASSIGSKRRFHPDYDPFIEIRRAKERLERYRNKDDWSADMLLSDDADEDLHRYEEKLKRRLRERGSLMEPIELERRQLELLRRQKDIDMGKVTDRYAEYVLSVPKPERERYHPRTPNKFRKVSRRAWDGMIRKWRKHLHNFEDLNFEESWRSLASSYVSGQSTPDRSLSGASSDHEGENIAPIDAPSVCLSTEFKNIHKLTASPTLRCGTRSKSFLCPQVKPEDEEDTLQAHPKASRGDTSRSPFRRSRVENIDDDDTLSAMPVWSAGSPGVERRLTRSSHPRSSFGPNPEAIHSGLTNDMGDFYHVTSGSQKRSSAHLNKSKDAEKSDPASIDITDMTAFPKLRSGSPVGIASPSKRAKRGILSENGLSGPSSCLFGDSSQRT